ncbi:MAG TPA: M48 family metallopeptidase [Rectinemataceae bacterium]|nr:M48 family metallopeptidase [Rectinemataceae bacterium]
MLTLLNYRRVMARSGRLPAALLGQVSDEEHRKASRYSLARMRLGFVSGPVVTLLMLAAVLSGFFGLLDHTIAGAIHGEYLRGAAFMGAFALLLALLSLPFSLYSTFVLEKRFGFNTTKPLTWLLDALKGAALSIVLGLPLLLLLFLFMDGTGRLWWLWAFALFTVVDVIISLLYPLVIAPLFNKFSPLPEGSLSERIRGMADRLGFRMSGIFVMDGSRRSRHSNAYFTGFGRLKRVVLFDTLVSQMSEEEILAVLAHEIGHEKKRHVIKGMILSTLLSLLGFWLLSLVQSWGPVYPAFGFTAPSKEALLLIVSLASGPCTFFLTPLFSAWSRRHEYEADRFSAAAAGAKEMGSALVKLNRENASNLTPHPLYSFWYYSHPTLLERLSAIGWSAKDGGDRPGDVS